MNAPTRPVLRWHGGKYLLADWIISHFPAHRVYVEPFGGAASVLMRKARSAAEVYNDLDDQVVGLFRVLQEPAGAARLLELLRLTPFARREFELSYAPAGDQIEAARRLIMRSFMGFGSNAHSSALRGHRSTGFRSNSNRSGTTPAHDWANYPDAVPAMIARIAGVVIESRDALEVMTRHDGATTLHYVDPPYVHETRSDAHMYRHELDGGGHVKLLACLRSLAGMIVLSGYATELYDRALFDWRRVTIEALADGARPRVEVLWLNPACAAALDREGRAPRQMQLLEAVDD
jgi:DNA adenine methylase